MAAGYLDSFGIFSLHPSVSAKTSLFAMPFYFFQLRAADYFLRGHGRAYRGATSSCRAEGSIRVSMTSVPERRRHANNLMMAASAIERRSRPGPGAGRWRTSEIPAKPPGAAVHGAGTATGDDESAGETSTARSHRRVIPVGSGRAPFLLYAAAPGASKLIPVEASHLGAVISAAKKAGRSSGPARRRWMRFPWTTARERVTVVSKPYPGFPTDASRLRRCLVMTLMRPASLKSDGSGLSEIDFSTPPSAEGAWARR